MKTIVVAMLSLACFSTQVRAQTCGAAGCGSRTVEDRLSRLERQVGEMGSRLDRMERIVQGLATVEFRLVDDASMMNKRAARSVPVRYAPSNEDDEPISLVADRPAPPVRTGTLAESETGRVEFRCYGNGAVRLPLVGGGMIAVGPEPARSLAKLSSEAEPFAKRASYVPTSYGSRTRWSSTPVRTSYRSGW